MRVRIINAKDTPVDPGFVQKMSEITLQDKGLAYRSPNLIKNSIQAGFFLVALGESNKILGWIEKYKIWEDWWGLSTLYVFPEYRNLGIGRGLLIPAGVKDLKNKNIFAATTNSEVQSVLEGLNFKKVVLSQLPLMVRINLLLTRYLNIKSLLKLLEVRSR
ncbi:MAG: hypothetical protein A2126_02840, partial [Candidatus Woykebacteria bacterium GWB1_45_5]